MKKEDYEGMYRIKRIPVRMKAHNARSWTAMERMILARGGTADFNSLEVVVKDHEHGTRSAQHPYQFITYCIRSGWLERAT